MLETLLRDGEVIVPLGLIAYRVVLIEFEPFVRASWFWQHHAPIAELHPVEWDAPDWHGMSATSARAFMAERIVSAILAGSVTRVLTVKSSA